VEDVLITCFIPGYRRDEAAKPHDVDHVSQSDQLVKFRTRDHQCTILFSRNLAQQIVNFYPRSDVDTLRRLFGQQNLNVTRERSGERDFLLIATAEVASIDIRRTRVN
jgi:hypothetical protein